MSEYNKEFLGQYLSDYYKALYPSKLVLKWLGYGKSPSEYMARREIAFIYDNDRHHRYQVFTDVGELEKALCSRKPHKIDIGAVYSVSPTERQRVPDRQFVAQERELVFDIDLTDYGDVRSCCSGASVCQKCWLFLSLAAKILRKLLSVHFGFKEMLFVFSGRRGLHCWVCDENARKLTNQDRSAVAEYLSFRLREPPLKKPFIHPMAYDTCRVILDAEETMDLVESQKWMADEFMDKLLVYCNDIGTESQVRTLFKKTSDPLQRFNTMKALFDPVAFAESRAMGARAKEPTFESTAFFYTFLMASISPRLDIAVSTATNHLLKSPFCVHPKTGFVAVPFNVESAHEFEVAKVPRVDRLIAELRNQKQMLTEIADNKENREAMRYKYTSLAPFVQMFEAFVNSTVKTG